MGLELNGTEHAHKRALLKAIGITEDELSKPLIAIICNNSSMANGSHISNILEAVKTGISNKGGVPIVMPCTNIVEEFTAGGEGAKYAMPSRELIADSVESILNAHSFDGAVFVPSGDIAAAGMMLGCVRVNIPSVFVSGGFMASSKVKSSNANFASIISGQAKVKQGELDLSNFEALENQACAQSGAASPTFIHIAMDCFLEALGLALAGNGTIPACSPDRIRLAKESGASLLKLITNDITPRMIATKDAITNALAVDFSVGTTTSTMLHALALITELDIPKFNLDFIMEKIASKIPTLFALSPTCKFDNSDFYSAGGIMAVLNELNNTGLIAGSALSVTNHAISKSFSKYNIANSDVIKTTSSSIFPTSSLMMPNGNIAQECAFTRKKQDTKFPTSLVGKAKVFNSEEDAIASINAGSVQKGSVVVIRYEGPKGGPGMREMVAPIIAAASLGLENDVAFITDGRFSQTFNTLTVDCISPEAHERGKIALIEDGDKITIDLSKNKLDVDINAKDLKMREKKMRTKDTSPTGQLLRYRFLTTNAENGLAYRKKF